ncbi:MAG: hypothetical protein EPO27_10455 [Betaproteobacteria bacterium]|nr:MAG: hypothetical protein EPO27_10455 [Betaproteobacteria bacterium]
MIFDITPRKRTCQIQIVEGRRVKRCSGCKILKPVEAFNQGSGPGGYHRHCRDCCKAFYSRRKARAA